MEKNIYFEVDAINSSLLKKVKNPKNLLEEVQETDEMIIGSAVDCILTRNGDFDKEFMYSGDYRISLAVKNIIDKVFELSKNKTTLEEEADLLLRIGRESEYQNNWKDDTLVKNLINNGNAYYNDLIKANGRKIITLDMSMSIDISLELIMNSDIDEVITLLNSDKVMKQLPVFWSIENKQCKSLLDFVYIDDEAKKIKIYDLKVTSRPALSFDKTYLKDDHAIQASFYVDALKYWYKDYDISFAFVVVSYTEDMVILFDVSDKALDIGRYGKDFTTHRYMGYLERIEALDYINIQGDYIYPYYVVKKNKKLLIDDNTANNKDSDN